MEKLKNNQKLIIFDCDGVLVESEPIAISILIKLLQEQNFNVDNNYGKQFFGLSAKDCVEMTEKKFSKKVSVDFFEKFASETHKAFKNKLKPIKGIELALANIPNPKCVASGSTKERVKLSLDLVGISKYLENIFSATDVKQGKPFPDIFLFAAEKMGYLPNECIVIEDSDAGMKAGLAANMKVYLYKPSNDFDFNIPNDVVVFSDMEELPLILQN